jgi:RNA polymerase sigma-70 factor, ECF subfamily
VAGCASGLLGTFRDPIGGFATWHPSAMLSAATQDSTDDSVGVGGELWANKDGSGPPQSNSAARLTELVRSYSPLAWRALRRLGVSPNALDDATQEVFIVISRHLGTIEPGRERAYVYSTALRVAANHRRCLRARREDSLEALERPLPSEPVDMDHLLDRKRMRELLERVLCSMPDELREAFVLFELEGLSRTELAETLALPAGTVASRVRRAREYFERVCAELRPLHQGAPP